MREETEVSTEPAMTLAQRVDALDKKLIELSLQHRKSDENAENHHHRLARLEKETGLDSPEPRSR